MSSIAPATRWDLRTKAGRKRLTGWFGVVLAGFLVVAAVVFWFLAGRVPHVDEVAFPNTFAVLEHHRAELQNTGYFFVVFGLLAAGLLGWRNLAWRAILVNKDENDEPWRRPTSLRYLETMKEWLAAVEAKAESGDYWPFQIPDIERSIETYKERIKRLVAGDTSFEIHQLEADIKKEQLNKEKLLRTPSQASKLSKSDIAGAISAFALGFVILAWPGATAGRWILAGILFVIGLSLLVYNKQRSRTPDEMREMVHNIDIWAADAEQWLKELREFDVRQLWQDQALYVPGTPKLTRVAQASLDDIRQKVETINAIPDVKTRQPDAAPAPKLSPEVQRQQNLAAAQAQLKRDEQNKAQRLNEISGGKRFEDLPPDKQDLWMEEDNDWNEKLRKDRQLVRKYM